MNHTIDQNIISRKKKIEKQNSKKEKTIIKKNNKYIDMIVDEMNERLVNIDKL